MIWPLPLCTIVHCNEIQTFHYCSHHPFNYLTVLYDPSLLYHVDCSVILPIYSFIIPPCSYLFHLQLIRPILWMNWALDWIEAGLILKRKKENPMPVGGVAASGLCLYLRMYFKLKPLKRALPMKQWCEVTLAISLHQTWAFAKTPAKHQILTITEAAIQSHKSNITESCHIDLCTLETPTQIHSGDPYQIIQRSWFIQACAVGHLLYTAT